MQKKLEKQNEKIKKKIILEKTTNCLTIDDQAIGHGIEKCAKVKFVATCSTTIVKEASNQSSIKTPHGL